MHPTRIRDITMVSKEINAVLIVSAAVLLFFASCSSGSGKQDVSSSSRSLPPFKVTLEPIDGWRIESIDEIPEDDIFSITLIHACANAGKASVATYIRDDNNSKTLDEIIERRRDAISKYDASFYRETQDVSIDGYPGKEITYSYRSDNVDHFESSTYVLVDKYLLEICCRALEAKDYTKYENDLKAIVNLLKITQR